MRKFTIHIYDSGARFNPYSDDAFAEKVRDAARDCFGVNQPRAHIIMHDEHVQ